MRDALRAVYDTIDITPGPLMPLLAIALYARYRRHGVPI